MMIEPYRGWKASCDFCAATLVTPSKKTAESTLALHVELYHPNPEANKGELTP